MEDTVERVRSSLDDSIEYIIQGNDEHPNRNDINRELSSPNNRGVPASGISQGSSGGSSFATFQTNPDPFTSGGQGLGNSPFGQPVASSGFGQAGGFGQTGVQSSPFGNQGAVLNQQGGFGGAISSSPFASNQNQPPQNGFGQQNGSAFDISMQQDQSMLGQPQQTSNPFGQQPNGFGQMNQASSGFGAGAQPMAMNGNQIMPDDPPQAMFGMNEQQFQEAYQQARQAGGFQNGTVPMVAPKSEWMGN
jgi:nucleoporin NUP42